MTRILFAWEMGANYGHVNKIAPIAGALGDGVEISIAAREVVAVRALAPDLHAQLLPAPFSPTRAAFKNEKPGICYPGVLRTEGWDNVKTLKALMESWRCLFDLVKPDILVAQAAPTALLAARGLGIKTVVLGSGYDTPPRASPMPCFTPQDAQAVREAHAQEQQVTETANAALAAFGAPVLPEFRALLDVDETLLVAYRETDHFAPRDKIEPDHPAYLGQILTVTSGLEIAWRADAGPRILAYLRPGFVKFNVLAQAFARLGATHDIILAAPGIDPALAEQLRQKSVRVVDGPVRLDRLLKACDLGISHGTNGIGAAFVAYGVAQLGVPTHREQLMFSQAVARAGLGLGIAGKFGAPQMEEAIRQALATPDLRKNARATKARIETTGLARPAERAAEILRDLAAR